MSNIKKLLILIILIIFIYIIIKLIKKRMLILDKIKSNTTAEEFLGFFASQKSELKTAKRNNSSIGIGDYPIANANLPLREYCIKASYNTAQTGNYLNLDMITYVLSRGVRFLDFEIVSIDKEPYVAYTSDSEYKNIDSSNKIKFYDVINIIANNAFMAPSPNPGDPLFVNLRIKTNNTELFQKIAMMIDMNLKPRLYNKQISGDTLLSEILGKIIFIIDKKTAPEYMNYPICESSKQCYKLNKYMNMESGGDNLRIYSYGRITNQSITPPIVHDDGLTTDIVNYKMVIPDAGLSMKILGILRNPNFNTLVSDYGVQIVCYRFYENDTNLMNYEKAFRTNKSAIVPISKMIKYLEEQK
jgi:hypothetical protein